MVCIIAKLRIVQAKLHINRDRKRAARLDHFDQPIFEVHASAGSVVDPAAGRDSAYQTRAAPMIYIGADSIIPMVSQSVPKMNLI